MSRGQPLLRARVFHYYYSFVAWKPHNVTWCTWTCIISSWRPCAVAYICIYSTICGGFLVCLCVGHAGEAYHLARERDIACLSNCLINNNRAKAHARCTYNPPLKLHYTYRTFYSIYFIDIYYIFSFFLSW